LFVQRESPLTECHVTGATAEDESAITSVRVTPLSEYSKQLSTPKMMDRFLDSFLPIVTEELHHESAVSGLSSSLDPSGSTMLLYTAEYRDQLLHVCRSFIEHVLDEIPGPNSGYVTEKDIIEAVTTSTILPTFVAALKDDDPKLADRLASSSPLSHISEHFQSGQDSESVPRTSRTISEHFLM